MTDKQRNSAQSPTDAAALRKQAEEQARTMKPTSLSAQTPEEIQRMLHELRVHQIELEMQNEELRTAQAQIEAGRERYFAIYDQAPVGYCTLSEKGLILEANLTAATLLGVTRSAMVKLPISRFILKEDQDIYYLHRKLLFETGEPQECELRLIKPDGTIFWAYLTTTTAQVKDGAHLYRVVIVDITDRKRNDQQLSAALSEKEVLLREVHHRVKNNLAAIISIIDMQRRTLEDPSGQIILVDLSNRIRSMSLVHEKLYRADSLATIDFHDYVQALTSHLRTTFGSPDIICLVDAPGVTIRLDLASPCGLIVNELVTNALKYAFPNGKPRPGNTDCQVLVRLHRDKDTYFLTVADNGIGWPAGFDWIKTKTLGMILVRMLGQHQLGGHYVVDQEEGTSLTLTFTDRKKEVPVHGLSDATHPIPPPLIRDLKATPTAFPAAASSPVVVGVSPQDRGQIKVRPES